MRGVSLTTPIMEADASLDRRYPDNDTQLLDILTLQTKRNDCGEVELIMQVQKRTTETTGRRMQGRRGTTGIAELLQEPASETFRTETSQSTRWLVLVAPGCFTGQTASRNRRR